MVIQQGQFVPRPDGTIEAILEYIPYSDEPPDLPLDAIMMINAYDPSKELILMIKGDGATTSLMIKAEQIGSTPEILYRKAITKDWKTHIMPGAVVTPYR